MTWFGDIPRINKAEAVRLLPSGACKYCVNILRCNIGKNPDLWGEGDWKCPRCGTNMRPILEQFYKPDDPVA
jgi:hypothetical protein